MTRRLLMLLSLSLLTSPLAGRGLSVAALTLDQATAQVRRDSGGRVLSAERAHRKGREMYRFKVLTPDGRVRKVWVDPGSGVGQGGRQGRGGGRGR